MNCDTCGEYLADFLLDELPESQAVLVHEHLNICAGCMKSYKELKGTGKALEAIPALKPITGSEQFKADVESKAAIELQKIIDRLPPDKRLRLEARREARRSQALARSTPPPKPSLLFNPLLIMAVIGATIIAVLMLYSGSKPEVKRLPLGRLTLALGGVDQFYQRENQPHTPAVQDKEVFTGDSFSTHDNGSARFDLKDGGVVFMAGSSSSSFRLPPEGLRTTVLSLEKGEIGIQRNLTGPTGEGWDLQVGGSTLLIPPGAHLYARAPRSAKDSGELLVVAGSVQVLGSSGQRIELVEGGQRLSLPSAAQPAPRAERAPAVQVPAWRTHLITALELDLLFGGMWKIVSRPPEGIELELRYRPDIRRGQADWNGEALSDALRLRTEGGYLLPPKARLKHTAPFAPPLTLDVVLNHQSPPEAAFAFGAVHTPDFGASVDVAAEATLQVRESNRTTGSASLPLRVAAGRPERLRLDLVRETANLTAVLNTSGGRSRILSMGHARVDEAGQIWLQSLTEGVIIDEIVIRGLLKTEWLQESLGR